MLKKIFKYYYNPLFEKLLIVIFLGLITTLFFVWIYPDYK